MNNKKEEGKRMSRRTFLKAGAAAVSGLSAASLAAGGPSIRKSEQSRPNILIIICDQMNLDAISAYKQLGTHAKSRPPGQPRSQLSGIP